MGHTDTYRRQHKEILQIASEVTKLTSDALTKDADRVRTLLSSLAGKLGVHLSMEDNALYPRLLVHADQAVSATAKRFQTEMGGLKSSFDTFSKKWSADSIRSAPQAFSEESKAVMQALSQRMDREDADLYQIVDRTLG
jgi:hemerythrin-like domain-containing protein